MVRHRARMGFPETFGSGSVVMGDTAILAQRACVSLNVPEPNRMWTSCLDGQLQALVS